MKKRKSRRVHRRRSRAKGDAIGRKIRLLMHEGYPQAQAIAIALSMARSGKLGKVARREVRRYSRRRGARKRS